ncbi:hypothetical protein EXIGLDRAFT_808251 [Exidia glandulosa HHB12029]|uniref:DUF6535 domain-containing protein n=1 Tax=Exidia glandulosa HHB12029 TaxID=1314781 RepID=A0A165LWE1_EXIGL|nr:hypothetical protein EXIGLDRAFT_808251 [Exidia glandulosa HHB12029]
MQRLHGVNVSHGRHRFRTASATRGHGCRLREQSTLLRTVIMDPNPSPDVPTQPAPPRSKKYEMVEELDTDFKRKYPPDLPGREMEDGARVWKVYRDEATANDNTILDGWNKTIDILLIFAGLFSAVATAFIIESYKLLQPDSEAYTANALYILLNNNSALPPPPSLDTSPSPLSRWINGLWFTSLILALAVALLCILAKQWISEYSARNNASAQSPRHWARRHQVYFQAMSKWPVAEFISVLPFLLHLALFLFFAGVVAFLWTLDRAISILVIAIACLLGVFYAASTLAPLWIPESPTSTPLVNQLRRQLTLLRKTALQLRNTLKRGLARIRGIALRLYERYRLWRRGNVLEPGGNAPSERSYSLYEPHAGRSYRVVTNPRTLPSRWLAPTDSDASSENPGRRRDEPSNTAARQKAITHAIDPGTDAQIISERIEQQRDVLDQDALMWLILAVSDTDANAVGLQSLGALLPTSSLAKRLRKDPRLAPITVSNASTRTATRLSSNEVMRIVRSRLCMQKSGAGLDAIASWPVLNTLADRSHPDLGLLWSALHPDYLSHVSRAESEWRAASQSLSLTAVLLIRSNDPMSSGGSSDSGPSWTRSCSEIHFLMCCQFEDLSDAQWDLIFHSLRPPHIPKPPPVMRELWLINTVARLIYFTYEHDLSIRAGSDLINRVLDTVRRKISEPPHTKLDGVGKLMQLPYVTALFSGYLERLHPDRTRIITIAHILRDGADIAQLNYVNVVKFVSGLNNLLLADYPEKHNDQEVSGLVSEACLRAFPKDGEEELEYDYNQSGAANQSLAMRDDQTRLAVVLDCMLLPLEEAPQIPPIWKQLCAGAGSHAWIDLVERMAVSLCYRARRGKPSLDMVDAFFAELDCSKLVAVWVDTVAPLWQNFQSDMYHARPPTPQRISNALASLRRVQMDGLLPDGNADLLRDWATTFGLGADAKLLVHIFRHCVELRPTWWMDFLTAAWSPSSLDVSVIVNGLFATFMEDLVIAHWLFTKYTSSCGSKNNASDVVHSNTVSNFSVCKKAAGAIGRITPIAAFIASVA